MKRALVVGSALCWREDVERALDLSEFDGVIAAKGAGLEWPGELDAWVTLHPDRVEAEVKKRAAKGFPPARAIYAHTGKRHFRGITHEMRYTFETQQISGSSGLFAVKVAATLGYERIVMCGIPLEKSFGRIGSDKPWTGHSMFRQGFLQSLPIISSFTRSMSGWTATKLGEPTSDWLNGVE